MFDVVNPKYNYFAVIQKISYSFQEKKLCILEASQSFDAPLLHVLTK